MPFEPLQTDEEIVGSKPKSMDDLMLAGCTAFVGVSIGSYVLSVWPFFVFQRSEDIGQLGLALGLGCLPAAAGALLAVRKFGLPAATGFVGGSVATAIFLFLRLQQAFVEAEARRGAPPDYPALTVSLLPIIWVALSLISAVVVLPRGELPGE